MRLHTQLITNTKKVHKRHSFSVMYRAYGMVLLILAVTFLFGFFYNSAFAKEESAAECYKYYTSIEIESGDTLWSIACEYANEDFTTVQDYIDELKFMNNMTSDQIIEGHYLTVAYYSDVYK